MTKKTDFYLGIMGVIVIISIISVIFKQQKNAGKSGFTTEECSAQGGEVINILDDKRADNLEFRRDHKAEFCNNPKDYLGDVTGLHCPCICCLKQSLTKEQAISLIKNKYAHMSDFPYEGLPPKSVVAEKYQDDWYVAFIREGSGRPIIEARCFIVKLSGDVIENGKFIPKLDDNNVGLNFSMRKCENSE